MKRALLLALLALPGCVDRELAIKPDPDDALVFVDGSEVGTKDGAARYRYEHYGIHRVVVRKQGYAVDDRLVTLDPPWYQVFPIDFFFDVLWPGTIDDHRVVEVKLEKRADLTDQKGDRDILLRARAMAEEAKKP